MDDEHHPDQPESFHVWCDQLQSECAVLGVMEPDEYDWLNLYRQGLSPFEAARQYGESPDPEAGA